MDRPWVIYTLSDTRTQAIRYIGVTFHWKRRLTEHISKAAKGGRSHRDCWIRSLLAVGVRPTFTVIQHGSGDAWKDAERMSIAEHRKSCDLVNLTDGGDGTLGYVPTPELRAKWSEARKGVKYSPGRVPGMRGKSHGAEAREKIRRASTGRTHSVESRAKLSAAHTGKTLSADHRRLLSEAHLGKALTEEHRRKIAASTTGRKPVECVENGQVFTSITEAASVLGISESSVSHAIRKGFRCAGNHLRFA